MSDYLKRIFGQLVAGLLAYASRLVRPGRPASKLLDESTAVLEEAAHLEAKGQPQQPREVPAGRWSTTPSDVLAADAVPQPSLNGGGNHDPFALPRPDTTANQPAGEGSAQPRRRGRRPGKNGAKPADEQPPQQQAAPQSDPTVAPDHHL